MGLRFKKKTMKNKFSFKIFGIILTTIIFNLLLMQIGHTRIDLTKEKKYTLSKKTKVTNYQAQLIIG